MDDDLEWNRVVILARDIYAYNIMHGDAASAFKAAQQFWDYVETIERVSKQVYEHQASEGEGEG